MAALCSACGCKKAHSIHVRALGREGWHDYMDNSKPGLKPMSEGMRNFRKESGYDAAKAEAVGTPCQILSPRCTGIAEALHEVLPRGRGGGLRASYALAPTVAACNACNAWVTSDGLLWAKERGFVVSRRDLGLDRIS